MEYYIRYADDFVILSHEKHYLKQTLLHIVGFLREHLKLELHPDKVSITTFASGVDFLGWVHFPDHRVVRTSTKKRMLRRLAEKKGSDTEEATKQSYRGVLKHGNAYHLRQEM